MGELDASGPARHYKMSNCGRRGVRPGGSLRADSRGPVALDRSLRSWRRGGMGGLEVETGSEKKIRGGVVHMPVTPTYPGVYIEEIPSIRGSMGGSIP